MFVMRNWYVAGRSRDIGDKPLTRTICGHPITFFREGSGALRAVSAVCPHRGVDLGTGHVVDDALQCPFHGFRFAADGRCVKIPSQPDAQKIPAHVRVATFPVVEQQDLVWIWPEPNGTAEGAPPAYAFMDPALLERPYHQAAMTFQSSYLNALENALDGQHLAFAHKPTLPTAPEIVPDYDLVYRDDERAFTGHLKLTAQRNGSALRGSGAKSLARRVMGLFVQNAPMTASAFTYDLNGAVYFDQHYAGGAREFIYSFFTPIDEYRTLAVSGFVRNHSLNPVGELLLRKAMDNLMNEDKTVLANMTPIARGAGGLPKPALVKGDYTSAPFRRIYGKALRREGQAIPWLSFPEQGDDALESAA